MIGNSHQILFWRSNKKIMSWAGSYVGEERCIQGFGGKI